MTASSKKDGNSLTKVFTALLWVNPAVKVIIAYVDKRRKGLSRIESENPFVFLPYELR